MERQLWFFGLLCDEVGLGSAELSPGELAFIASVQDAIEKVAFRRHAET